jgi:hypothetical protein
MSDIEAFSYSLPETIATLGIEKESWFLSEGRKLRFILTHTATAT